MRPSGPQRAPPPWMKRRQNAQPRRKLLDVRRKDHFRYDVREALAEGSVPEAEANAIFATVFSKGSVISLDEAKDFIHQKSVEGVLPGPVRDRLMWLVDRYSTWR